MRALERTLYETLVREHSHELYRFAFRLCGSRTEAEDLVQESYAEAWKGLPSLLDPRKARAWLFQILRHRHAHAARRRARRPEISDAAADRGVGSCEAQASDRDLLQHALDGLEDRYKIPLLMVFVEGLTCQQVADQLGLPLGTVLSRIHRARRSMRGRLETRDEDAPRLTPIEGGRA